MRLLLLLLALVAPAQLGAAEPKLTAKLEKAEVPDALAEPVRKLLDEQALVVRDGDAELMTVWFRTEIPAKATEEQVKNGLTYREIPEGALVGAVRFPAKFTDFRKQEIAAGVYTLRFAVQPDIGDHTGTAPHPEFCLMCQAKEDKSAEPIEKKKLIEVSSLVNEGRHPAVLLMWPNNGRDAGVKVVSKGDGVYAATVKRPVVAGDQKTTLGFAVTVAGVRKE
ncbi:hypothetical protein [Frigoriglobus tundricola]|uniref:Uncharacterized protein n=1 Tax=Frigoriglobus tundricola TaxID=2774151 RepID=A0A6M5Z308_9BACT|nr:hypothetical protein [Frigoriglobus tundricola]QJW99930.1 hypothetical protein FTUN_7553 [Frigoriglobus tundricola]